MRAMTSLRTVAACLALLAGLGGCATPPPASDPDALADYREANDPLEPTNRVMFRINDGLDTLLVRPLVIAYGWVTPGPIRHYVHNVLTNLGNPVVLANDVLQAKPRRAGDTFMRLLINSTVGVAGVFDVATEWGYPAHSSDFGTTLAVWGVDEGPFLFLPLLGPSNLRDGVGYGVDVALDPLTWINGGTTLTDLDYARWGVDVLDVRADVQPDIDKALATALDPYATYRSLYRQYRAAAVSRVENDTRATTPAWFKQPPAN